MSCAQSIISEVESALQSASGAKRVEVLRRVTDLFVGEAENLTLDQTALFDGVIGQLISHIESRAAVELSRRLAPIPNAPLNTVRALALHDDIEVSGPILSGSERLTDDDLIEIATTKSNGHLVKISCRTHLKEPVTDVLVERGDSEVANGLAINSGARFSQIGMAKLIMRADGDDRLTESVGRRVDIPPPFFRQLLMQATAVVRNKLLAAATPNEQDTIKKVMAEIAAQVSPNTATVKRKAEAQRIMKSVSQDSHLVKAKILDFARLKKTAEVVAGLSVLIAVPFEQIDRLFHTSNGFGLMVLCKTLALEWRSAELIILSSLTAEEQLEELRIQFDTLSIASAQRLFRCWVGRQKVANPVFEVGCRSTQAAGNDFGAPPDQLRELASRIPNAAELLQKMLVALRIDPETLVDSDPLVLAELQRLCTACTDEKRCRHETGNGTAAKHFREFCPNAVTLDSLSDRNARPLQH